jgi:hypothetical protein
MNKYPEAASVVQQVHKVCNDIENLAGCTPDKVGERSEWTSIVNSTENRVNFCKALDGKPHFTPLYGMYTVTLNELKTILKVGTQEGQRGAVNRTSVQSTAQYDDFQEVKRRISLIISRRQPRSRLNQSQHPQLSRCLQAPREPGGLPLIMMSSTTNLI